MQEEFKCNDLVEVLPEFSEFYDAVVGRKGKITGIAGTSVFVGDQYIVDFVGIISEEFPWTSCYIAARYLKVVQRRAESV